ncbi:MAG: collagen-binding domain-containing protein [Solirubrobacteraceae bacterium]
MGVAGGGRGGGVHDGRRRRRGRARPAPRATDCATLGQAAQFAAFSNGDFNASPPGGESITGRIAAARDVTLEGPGSGGVFVNPAPGDAAPTVVAGRNFSAGQSGAGGTLNGGVRYGGTSSVASNFVINGGVQQGDPPFTFSDEFDALRTLSATLADLGQTSGASVSLSYGQLQLTGTGTGLNVFTVSAAQLTQAQGVVITLTQPGATALVNVTTDTQLTLSEQYMNLTGATAATVAWNLPLATSITLSGSVDWQGLVLAPNAELRSGSNGQIHGQLIAATIPTESRTLTKVPFTGCLPPTQPPTPPDESLTLASLCVNAAGDATMRLRNTGDQARGGQWVDLGGTDFGRFNVPAHSDLFFVVENPTTHSVVSATSGTTTVTATVVHTPCQGQITVRLVTVGPEPGGTWNVHLDSGVSTPTSIALASGTQDTVTVPGGYVPGVAPIDQVVGGLAYTVSVPDPRGGTATVSLNPIEILDGQHEIVTVTIAYEESGGGGDGGGEVEIPPPVDPTLPPGAPDPLPGPPLGSSSLGTDLAITHEIAPQRLATGGTILTVTTIHNRGRRSAVGVVAREVPEYHPRQADSVAHVLKLTTTRGRCTSRRPVHCSLGTLAPGATVTIRSVTRVLVAASLRSIVVVSSDTPETNTANNMAIALVTTTSPTAALAAHVAAPPVVHVTQRLRYRVSVTPRGKAGAASVRLCTKAPASLLAVRAPGTVIFNGQRCRTAAFLAAGRTLSFTVSGLASARGHVFPFARATAVDVVPARAATRVLVLGPLVACTAAHLAARHRPPTARAAC